MKQNHIKELKKGKIRMKKVKVILVKNNKETFEKEIEKYINNGYDIKNSNITEMATSIKGAITFEKANQQYIYYALLIKE